MEEENMRVSDVITGLILIIAGITIFLEAQSFPPVPGQRYGSDFFPSLVGVLMSISGLALALTTALKKQHKPWAKLPEWANTKHGLVSFILILASLVLYMLAAEWLGFWLTAFAVIFGLQLWMRARVITAFAVAVGASTVFYLVFAVLLRVPLQQGLIEQLF
jgi:putative tricarboxylic transport membrane protein